MTAMERKRQPCWSSEWDWTTRGVAGAAFCANLTPEEAGGAAGAGQDSPSTCARAELLQASEKDALETRDFVAGEFDPLRSTT